MMNTNTMATVNNKVRMVKTQDLLEKLAKQAENHYDRTMSMNQVTDAIVDGEIKFSENSKSQFYGKLSTNESFMEEFDENPKLKIEIVKQLVTNYDRKNKDGVLVRFAKEEDGKDRMRAILSSDYSIIDNLPVMQNLLSAFDNEIAIRSFANDDYGLRIQMLFGDNIVIKDEGKDDVYKIMADITNSETGNKTFDVRAGLFRQWCTNGAVSKISGIDQKIRHIYKSVQDVINIIKCLSIEKISDGAHQIIDMYRTASGIYIPKGNVDMEIDEMSKAIKLGKKTSDFAKTLKNAKYGKDSLFNIYGAVTEAIWRGTTNVHLEGDREQDAYVYMQSRAKTLQLAK